MIPAVKPSLIRGLVAVGALAFGFGMIVANPQLGAAQGSRILPAASAWCGVTDAGGSVVLGLSSDLRFVDWIEINQPPPDDVQISTREGNYGGTNRAQIADNKFIFRKDRQETECTTRRGAGPNPPPSSRCRTAPCRSRCTTPGCRGSSQVCETKEVNEMMIRGTFHSPESLRGVYTVIVEDGTNTRGRAPIRVQRQVGNFIAWPSNSAPCP